MDKDHDILKQFGGIVQNELNTVLKLDEDNEDRKNNYIFERIGSNCFLYNNQEADT